MPPCARPISCVLLCAAALLTNVARANTTSDALFGLGPGSVPADMKALEKSRQDDHPSWPSMPSLDEIGLVLGADYNLLSQGVTESLGKSSATGGALRFYGTWVPITSNPENENKLVFKLEHRHAIGSDLPPSGLLLDAGVAALSGPTFSDNKTVLTNLYWGQNLHSNQFGYIAGIVDVADYADVYAFVNVWTEFNNLAFSTNPSMPVPNQGLGVAVRWLFQSNVYVLGGIADINGDPHAPEDAFDSFFSDAEFFKHIEIGLIGSWDERMTRNTHITIWQSDAREELGIEADKGVALSWSPKIGEWQPFLRGGYADKGTAVLKKSYSAGVGKAINSRQDAFGVALNWGKTANSSSAQIISELYFKWNPFKHLLVSPSVQFIDNPANNNDASNLWLGALKVRVTF